MYAKTSGFPLAAIAILLSGCAILPEGVSFPSIPNAEDWSETRAQLIQNKEDAVVAGLKVGVTEPGVIVIGRVGPFRDFSDDAVFEDAYKYYSRIMVSVGESENMVTPQELRSLAAGWTTITHAGIPQLGFLMSRAYVPPDKVGEIDFSSIAGTYFGGAREDLVAGVSTINFPFFVVRALLCEDGKNYSECSDAYKWGFYDVYSGKEISSTYEIKDRGVMIDTSTYKVIGR